MSDASQILVFDRALLRNRRDRAAAAFAAHKALLEESDALLRERLAGIKEDFHAVLDLGAHDGALARSFATRGATPVVACDLSEKMLCAAPADAVLPVAADEEFLPFAPGRFDLVISNLSLQWVNDLPGALLQIKNALKPGGLFLAALAGGATLHELRAALVEGELAATGGASPRLAPSLAMPAASALLQRAGFALPVVDSETVTFAYPDMPALMHDLRGMGATNIHRQRLRYPSRRRIFHEAERIYRARYARADGRLPASFEILFLHGRRPF